MKNSDVKKFKFLDAEITLTPVNGGVSWTVMLPNDDTVFLDGITYGSYWAAYEGARLYVKRMSVRWTLGQAIDEAHSAKQVSQDQYNTIIKNLDYAIDRVA